MSASCLHCHRALPADAPALYCCAGCESARAIVDAMGLQRFDALGGAPGPVAVARADDAVVEALTCAVAARGGAGPCPLDVDVEGVTCASCAWLVEKASAQQRGVLRAVLNPALGKLSLSVDPSSFDARPLVSTLAALGHRVGVSTRTSDPVTDALVLRFGVAAALAMSAMVFAFSFYFGLNEADDGVLATVFARGGVVAAVLAVVVGGQPFYRGAWAGLRAAAPTMDLPIALGMSGALLASIVSLASGGTGVYFDTVAVFVTLMLLGRLLERRIVEQNRRVLLAHDGDVAGLQIRRVSPVGVVHRVAVGAIEPGDVMLLAPGELVPVEATATTACTLSTAWIDGESDATTFAPRAAVPAGAHHVGNTPLRLVASSTFDSSRLAALLAPIPERAPDSFFARLSRVWVFGVLVLAVVGLAIWWPQGPVRALEVLTALLVVTCPCAFGIAAPLALERAHANLRARGVFVKSSTLLARARNVHHVVFDKTGTLTSGELCVVNPDVLHTLSDDDRAVLATMTAGSNHPRSRALHAVLSTLRLVSDVDVIEEPGVGLRATHHGRTWSLVRGGVQPDGDEELVFAVDGVERARLQFREVLRVGAHDEIARLRALGVQVYIASGDAPSRVAPVAARLHIPGTRARGGMSPEDKRDFVRSLGRDDTMFIGDGVNDALACAAATCAGTPAIDRPHLPARADFFLLGGDLSSIVDTLLIARQLRSALVVLLSVATAYNVVTITLSLLGVMTPLMVALLMPASSVSLIAGAVFALRNRATARLTTTANLSPASSATLPLPGATA